MKRVSKLFVLILTLSLLCGVVFAVMSSAADETPRYWYTEDISESVTGATRKHRDFTGESFDNHQILDGKNEPNPKTSDGPQDLWANAKKNGHILSVTDPSGNTYIEYASRVDRNDGATGNDDAVVGLHPNSSTEVNGLSYVTFEFDMMTPTDFPAELKIFLETRFFGESGEHVFADGAKPRPRKTFATYSKSNGAWNFGEGTLSLKAGEWAHVSLVFQINKTVNNDGTVNFKDSVAKAYVNGQYMTTISEFFPAEYSITDDLSARIYYCGVGYAYGNSLAGTKADDAVALDNMVYTTYTDAYATDANAKLASLFGDNPVTDITDLGAEIVWTKDYELPEYSGDVEVIDEFGTIYGAEPEYGEVTSVKSALAFIRDNELAKATLKLYGSQYNPLYIDFPVELTIDFNGYQLKNGYEVPDYLYVEFNTETSTLTVSADPTKLVTINYYDSPKDFTGVDAVISQTLAQGRNLAFRVGEITPRELAQGNYIYTPLGTYKVYDEQGAEVDPAIFAGVVTEEMIGKTYSVYYDYERKGFATIHYYNQPKGTATEPTMTETLLVGSSIVLKTGEIVALPVVNGNTAQAPLTTYKIYDEEGNLVDALAETVGEEMQNKVYSIYFDYEEKTFAGDIMFTVALPGANVKFYESNDLWGAAVKPEPVKGEVTETTDAEGVVTKIWTETQYPAAIPEGAVITLYANCITSQPLYTNSGKMYIDLNGYELKATTQFFKTSVKTTVTDYTQNGDAAPVGTVNSKAAAFYIKNNEIYVYSSREGAKMTTTDRFINAQGGIDKSTDVKYYIGYKNADTVSANRIEITFGDKIIHLSKGDARYVYIANADLYNTKASANGLISAQQCRGLTVSFTDVNIFTKSPLTGSIADSGAKTVNFIDTNVYATSGLKMNYVNPVANSKGDFANGETVYNLTNSKIYNMSYGMTAGDADMGANTKAVLTVYLHDTASRISGAHATQLKLKDVSGEIVLNAETVVIDGVTYETLFGASEGDSEVATFEVYDMAFDDYTGAEKPKASYLVAAGGWIAGINAPSDTVYDFQKDPYNTWIPLRYSVYDEDGNILPAGAAVAGATYKIFIEYDKESVAIAVIGTDGKATPYTDAHINAVSAPAGSTVVLLADECIIYYSLSWKNVKLDLNGKTVYNTVYTDGKKKNAFTPAADSSIFVYSSAEGAKYYQAVGASSSGYVAYLTQNNSYVYFGYQDADTLSPYRIDLHCGAFAELRNDNNGVYLGNLSIYKLAGDNYGFLNFRAGAGANRNIYVENCNIFVASGNIVALRENSANGQTTFKNTNFFVNSSGGFVLGEGTTTSPEIVLNFENVGIYGNMVSMGSAPAGTKITVNVKGSFVAPFTSDTFVIEDGKVLSAVENSMTLPGHTSPASGVYGQADTVYFKGTYTAAYALTISAEKFQASALQNMTMDTNVVVNLYIPVMDDVVSAKIGETEILDKTKIEVIDGKSYYVLSYAVAPKMGDQTATVVVTLAGGTTVDFEMSVARYAKKLLGLVAEEGTYVADAQNLMKYILTYIKEVAIKYGGADETVFADLGDITVDTNVEITEPVHTLTAINSYVTSAALNLDAYAGFAFKVAEGFVGQIKLNLVGVSAEYTYTADAPAAADEVIVLENVPVYVFRDDVVITVTPAEGETVSASFNLATYAAVYNEAYVKALYAYSLAAEAFNKKYPTVGTAK